MQMFEINMFIAAQMYTKPT